MVKRIIVASALALFSIGLAGVGEATTPRSPLPARQSPGVSTTPGPFAAVQSLRGANAPHGGLE